MSFWSVMLISRKPAAEADAASSKERQCAFRIKHFLDGLAAFLSTFSSLIARFIPWGLKETTQQQMISLIPAPSAAEKGMNQ